MLHSRQSTESSCRRADISADGGPGAGAARGMARTLERRAPARTGADSGTRPPGPPPPAGTVTDRDGRAADSGHTRFCHRTIASLGTMRGGKPPPRTITRIDHTCTSQITLSSSPHLTPIAPSRVDVYGSNRRTIGALSRRGFSVDRQRLHLALVPRRLEPGVCKEGRRILAHRFRGLLRLPRAGAALPLTLGPAAAAAAGGATAACHGRRAGGRAAAAAACTGVRAGRSRSRSGVLMGHASATDASALLGPSIDEHRHRGRREVALWVRARRQLLLRRREGEAHIRDPCGR